MRQSQSLVPSRFSTARAPVENHPSGGTDFPQLCKSLLLLAIAVLLSARLLHTFDHSFDPSSFLLRQVGNLLATTSWAGHADL
jgi:hypothetical protein